MQNFTKLLSINKTNGNNTSYNSTPKTENIIEALWRLQKVILDTLDFNNVVGKIVNGLLTELDYLKLGYRIVVLTLVDEQNQVLKRISLSQTKEAELALAASAVPFHEIEIPLSAQDNLLVRAILDKKPQVSHYWPNIFTPILNPEQAIANQEASGIKTSLIFPIIVHDKSIGALIFSLIKSENEVTQEEMDLIRGFTDIVGLAVQNARLYTSLQETSGKLKVANDKLKDLDVLKDEFVSVASHELRTPMTAIKSYLWMALAGKGGELNQKQKYYLDRAYNSTDRLIKLVNDMLNVSRIESGRVSLNVEKIDMIELVTDVIAEVTPRADELGVTIKVDPPSHALPPVLADSDKIKEVLINLIGNSMKFTPSGGIITIYFDTKDDTVITHVKDTGKGVEKTDIPKLFQKFGLIRGSYTTNQVSQGTGLGLYICKSIIALHRGEIWGESEGRDKGAEFSFSLKVYNEVLRQQIAQEQQGKEGIEIIPTKI